MRCLVIISVALSLSIAGALAQTQDAAPAPSPSAPTSSEASIHAYGDRDKTCLSWTDTYRHCERGDNDAIVCSNIGIACQPAEITCTRRSEPRSDQPSGAK